MEKLSFLIKLTNYPINWLHKKISKTQFFILSGVIVGLSSGAVAVILKTAVHYIHLLLSSGYFSRMNNLIFLISPFIGIILTVFIVKYFFKGKLGRGISNILYEIAKKSSFVRKDKMYSHVITSSVTVGFGGSAGLEAPIVVTGSAIGSNYARVFNLSYKERTVLLAAGAAAGIAAVFDAPIAGVMFAIEVILPEIVVAEMIPIIISAVCGALCSKIILKEDILFFFKLQQHFDYFNVPFYIGLGIISGFLSLYYSKLTHKIEGIFEKYKPRIFKKAILGGLILGVLCLLFPPLFGEGYDSVKLLAAGNPEDIVNNSLFEFLKNNNYFLIIFVGLIMLIKVIATSLTLSSGGNGGNFAPSLFVGAFSGFFFSRTINLLHPISLPESNFTLVGMSGILSGVMHAPLTAIFLIAEITGGYELMIPLMIVSSLSYLISKHFEPYSMDTKKFASKGLIFTSNKDRNILSQIDIRSLIDKDIMTLEPQWHLRRLVNLIKNNNKNTFAIVTREGVFKGIITIDMIREIMFNEKFYDKTTLKDLMKFPKRVINVEDDIIIMLKKFDECNEWNLPVIEGKKYIGFISKSKIHVEYRNQLISQSGISD
jgi:chloride channel protein, CIC family